MENKLEKMIVFDFADPVQTKQGIILLLSSEYAEDFDFLNRLNRLTFGLMSGMKKNFNS